MIAKLKRREFITLLGGVAVAWPLAARAQQVQRVRRIGVLIPFTADEPEAQARMLAFAQGLQSLGWTVGDNLRIDIRWSAGDTDRSRRYAAELVALAPDVILASGGTGVGALLQATRTVQHHRFYQYGIWHEREIPGAAQRDRTAHCASGNPSGSDHTPGDRPVRRDPSRGAGLSEFSSV